MGHVAPLAVSIGDPAGIGPDIALLAWQRAQSGLIAPLPQFLLLTDPDHLARRAALLGVDHSGISVLPLESRLKAGPSVPLSTDAQGVIEAIERGVGLAISGKVSGLVTLPINKKSLYDAGFNYPGHTEYLGALAKNAFPKNKAIRPVMMLAGPELRTVPVTIHIPLKEVSKQLNAELIFETGQVVARDLRERFGIAKPRLAVSGLNPHAGEKGAMGHEDKDIIAPAILQLSEQGIEAIGPLPADTMFHAKARKTYDAALCMYHDQALIPAKALAFDEAVNVTLGLPFIRTSPDHGTAFDIAGTGKADPSSFIAALRMAQSMALASTT